MCRPRPCPCPRTAPVSPAPTQVVSLEKCTGVSSNLTTEEAIYETAAALKAKDPTTKVFFYFATDQQGLHCYACYAEYMAHPECE